MMPADIPWVPAGPAPPLTAAELPEALQDLKSRDPVVRTPALRRLKATVPGERRVHSLHAYFLRPGDTGAPILYTVEPVRDGGSFTTRRVLAVQHGEVIFSLSASFQVAEDGMTVSI